MMNLYKDSELEMYAPLDSNGDEKDRQIKMDTVRLYHVKDLMLNTLQLSLELNCRG